MSDISLIMPSSYFVASGTDPALHDPETVRVNTSHYTLFIFTESTFLFSLLCFEYVTHVEKTSQATEIRPSLERHTYKTPEIFLKI